MEKIKDALEKAKLQSGSERPISVAGQNKTLSKLSKEDELRSIAYNKTSIVKLDPAHLENYRIVAQNNDDPISSTFDSLRTQVLQKMEENNWRTIAIISPTPEAGKTVVAINLAISIAQQPQKTAMLVDFDLRRPSVAEYLGIKREKSINNFLDGNAELSEIIVNPGIPRLTIVPTNRPVNQSSETLSSNNIRKLILELKERYDSRIVIFDLPPLLNADDAMVLLPQVDCVLMVLGNGLHTESEIAETMRLLAKSNILGVVVNRAEIEPRAYYY
ncbi:MAG TPA: CpsD/CapB family tyrosine-protein kinase [Methylotenera sp.]|nr:CpsD/CapB family tyrosine-protein kinase [Methylotenera sp.]